MLNRIIRKRSKIIGNYSASIKASVESFKDPFVLNPSIPCQRMIGALDDSTAGCAIVLRFVGATNWHI